MNEISRARARVDLRIAERLDDLPDCFGVMRKPRPHLGLFRAIESAYRRAHEVLASLRLPP